MPGEDEVLRAAPAPPQPSFQDQINDPELPSLDDPSKEHGGREPSSKPKSPSLFVTASPEVSIRPSSSPKKPSLPPRSESLRRHRAISEPESSFLEQPLLPASDTPASAWEDEDEEQEEGCQREEVEQSPGINGTQRRRWKVTILIELAILVLAMGCLIVSLTVHRFEGSVIWGLEIWKWCLLVTVVCCGRLVTQCVTTVLLFLVECNFLLRQKVLSFVHGLQKSFQVCIWLGLVLLSWCLVFNQSVTRSPKTQKIIDYISRLLVWLLAGSVIWLVKTLLVKILASSFYRSRFFDRIQESIFHQYVLQVLSGPPVTELAEEVGAIKSSEQSSSRSTGKGKGKGKWEDVKGINQEVISAWSLKGLIDVIKGTGHSTFSEAIDEGDNEDTEINNETDAKFAAMRIFRNVAKVGHKYIDVEDLLRFLSKEEAENVLLLFEGAAESGKINKSAVRNWVVKAYLDRKSLAHSLNDTETIVIQMQKLATAIVIVVITTIMLLQMGLATTEVFLFVSSQILVVVFMFGKAVIIFVMHPFSVGDRCVVDGVQMIVEEMNTLTTVFLTSDNEKIYYPNSVLSTKKISNLNRSPDMRDSVEFSVDASTSEHGIGLLRSRIKMYIESKNDYWHAGHSVVVKDIMAVNRMNMALNVWHTMNFQDIHERDNRRSALVLHLKKLLEELGICYCLQHHGAHPNHTVETRTTTSRRRDELDYSIAEVMEMLRDFPEVDQMGSFYMKAATVLVRKENRDMFVALGSNAVRIEWLKHITNSH